MSISIEINGLKDIIKECESLATPREIEEVDRKALKRIGNLAQKEVQKVMPKSNDVSKSGKKGSRTFQHAKDNIPVKIKLVNGKLTAVVGWEKSNNDPYFYVKFIEFEFGNSKYPPIAPFKKVFIKQRGQWTKIFEEEYNKLLEKLR